MSWLLAPVLRPALATAAIASALLNLMLLVPALYSLQVFERVFASRSVETLAMLSALVAIALALAYATDVLRQRALQAAAATLVQLLQPIALARDFERLVLAGNALPTPSTGAHAAGRPPGDPLRDLASLRAFVAGPGLAALLDAPWLLLHLAAITLLDVALGAAATVGALAMLALAVLGAAVTRADTDAVQRDSQRLRRQQQAWRAHAESIVGLGMLATVVDAGRQTFVALLDRQQHLARRSAPLAAATRTLRVALQSGILGFGAWLVVGGHASPGIMVAATLLLGRAMQPLAQLAGGWRAQTQARDAWRRLQREHAPDPAAAPLTLPAPQGRIDIERLVYGGTAQREPLLRGIDLTIEPGQCLGLVGASGAGKTTLLRALLGLVPLQGGVVRLDGAEVARWDRRQIAPLIGYLPQDAALFPDTVAANIARLGDTSAEAAAAAVVAAATLAGAHDTILRLPQGYDTRVGEGGAPLSGGQRQQIALARALYGAPKLVVLDAPDTHLDAQGHAALARALCALKAARTTVVLVTQRRSLLDAADRVALLQDGRLRPATARLKPVVPLRTLATA